MTVRPAIPRILLAAAAMVLGLCGSAVTVGSPPPTLGTGTRTCRLAPGADCRGVVHRWTAEYHGNLRRARFTAADLRGADFRGADLRRADFRGAMLRHADFRGARLTGATFTPAPRRGMRSHEQAVCPPLIACPAADLSGASLQQAILAGADLSCGAPTCAPGTGVLFENATMNGADLSGAILQGATLQNVRVIYSVDTVANAAAFSTLVKLAGAQWGNTTCPDGTLTDTGC